MENTQLKELYLKATNQRDLDSSRTRKRSTLSLYGVAILLPIALYSWILACTAGNDAGLITVAAVFLALSSSLGIVACLDNLDSFSRTAESADDPSKFTGEDPAVLKTILDYLEDKVLRPKDEFVKDVQEDLKKLNADITFYRKDQHTLRDLAKEEADTHLKLINLETLQRNRAILEDLRALRSTLLSQKQRAEKMVLPIKADIARFEHHLTRLTRDQKLIESRKLTISIAEKISAYESFLLNLERECEQVVTDLRVMSSETIALGAARAEVRMDSSLTVEEERQLTV